MELEVGSPGVPSGRSGGRRRASGGGTRPVGGAERHHGRCGSRPRGIEAHHSGDVGDHVDEDAWGSWTARVRQSTSWTSVSLLLRAEILSTKFWELQVLPAWSRWTPRRKWPVVPPVRLAARAGAPGSRRPANSREPSRGPPQWPPRSAAPASPSGRVQELVAASGDPRRCSSGRGTMRPSPSSTSRSLSANGGFCGVD